MDTKLKDVIDNCKKEAAFYSCINCSCNEGECLENLLDIYNSKITNKEIDELNGGN